MTATYIDNSQVALNVDINTTFKVYNSSGWVFPF